MERIFTEVPDGLPEDYLETVPSTGPEVVHWRETNRRVFNTLHELNPLRDPRAIIRIDRMGMESFERDPGGIFLPRQVGFLVISSFPRINRLGQKVRDIHRLDVGAAYNPRPRDLNLLFEPDSLGSDFEHWEFLFRVAERLV